MIAWPLAAHNERDVTVNTIKAACIGLVLATSLTFAGMAASAAEPGKKMRVP